MDGNKLPAITMGELFASLSVSSLPAKDQGIYFSTCAAGQFSGCRFNSHPLSKKGREDTEV